MAEAQAEALAAPSGGVVETVNAAGSGPCLIVCEHASNHVPPQFGTLGLPAGLSQCHIAWDPGARAVAGHLSASLDAPLVASLVSRLVYDCNRPPLSDGATPARSEIFDIPGNRDLDTDARMARADYAYFPFRSALDQALDARLAAGSSFALVTVHSFTPVYMGVARAVEIGVLHDADSRLADALIEALRGLAPAMRIERNNPYGPADGVTYTLVEHGLSRGLANVMIEIRNDLLTTPEDCAAIAQLLERGLRQALAVAGVSASRRGVAHG